MDVVDALAVVLTAPGRLDIMPLELPVRLLPTQVLCRTDVVGVCGSDLAAFHGTHPYKSAPAVLGHELCATVIETGDAVHTVLAGDRVCSISYLPCGECEVCSRGTPNLCTSRANLSTQKLPGAFASYIVLDERMICPVPEGVSDTAAALAEPCAIAIHSLRRTVGAPVPTAVVGVGGIGTLVVAVASALGGSEIVALDRGPGRGERAVAFGAEYLDIENSSVHGRWANRVIVCAPGVEALALSGRICAPGGQIVMVAYNPGLVTVELQRLMSSEVTVAMSLLCTIADLTTVLGMMSTGNLRPEGVVTHRFPLRQTADAFELLAQRPHGVGRVVLDVKGAQ